MPLGSIRAEIIRDGVEDYEYLNILKERIKSLENSHNKNAYKTEIIEAKNVLIIPDNIVKSFTNYTQNPNDLQRYRIKVAHMIEKIKFLK